MIQTLGIANETPSQTAGPYVHIGCLPNFAGIDNVVAKDLGSKLVFDGAKGERITVTGAVFDGAGTALKDCMIEIWQADAQGFYNSPLEKRGTADRNFSGWGRTASNPEDGVYTFDTIKPGRVPFPDYGTTRGRWQAPHINFWIVARGINLGLNTRMYFPEEEEANETCPVLARIEHKQRIETLIAKKSGNAYTFDVRLQGERETVFFAC